MSEELLLLTMNEHRAGQVVNVDGRRFRIVRVIRWTGTVARLEIEPLEEDEDA